MQKKEDLRIIKTKKAIKQAFFELLDEKPFEKITVADIASKAMINRGTFYLHYKDKFDLMDSIEDEILDKIDTFLAMVTEGSLHKAMTEHQPLPHVVPMLTYLEENSRFFVLLSNKYGSLQLFSKIGEKYFYEFLRILHVSRNDIWAIYLKEIMISSVSSVLNTWISRGMKEPKEDLARFLTEIAMGHLAKSGLIR